MEDYKGYLICGSAVPTYLTGRQSKSLGIVLKLGRLGSVVEVKRIEGAGPRWQAGRQSQPYLLCWSVFARAMYLVIIFGKLWRITGTR